MTAIHGFRDYCPVPVKEKPAAIPPPPDEIRPEPVPSMISVHEFLPPAFDTDPPRRWWRFWRRA